MSSQAFLDRFTETGKKIVGAGLNYKSFADKAGRPYPHTPIIFLKATSSYVSVGHDIEVPTADQVNAEVELGVVIGQRCKRVQEDRATECVGGYCLALDLTNITLLEQLQASAAPWGLAKAFDSACPVSQFIPKHALPRPQDTRIWMKVNGVEMQNESTSDMIFTIPQLISYISQFMTLEPGDVILTGTPAGPEPIHPGDVVEMGVKGVLQTKFTVRAQ